ncbi:MAG: glutamine-hydrolyzing GMP synthase [Gammaproteobacteria bacterium]|nr:glutamine-hydrolyzing GMP synthase [Gammaproteobacteria bacterium]
MTGETGRILILDFGSQYTQMIGRRIRELNVYCEIHPYSISENAIKEFAPSGIILSGGPESVTSTLTPRAPDLVFNLQIPVLGICYGMQTMAHQLGGQVKAGKSREFGYAEVAIVSPCGLFREVKDSMSEQRQPLLDVWMSHGDHVDELPVGFSIVAKSTYAVACIADETRQFYGLQFHPEVSHTKQGKIILERFLFDICKITPDWSPHNIIESAIANIREKVGKEGVLLGLSGGVDSSVAALLLHEAIGDQLTCVFVDTGLLRLHEAEQVKAIFAEQFKIRLICVNAKDEFYTALQGVDDPEQKRKIIGKKFIDVFEAQAHDLKDMKWLAQGTIYSDVIESAQAKIPGAHVIKSHHNVGGLPDEMKLKLIEPLRELFKDEVRKIGLELGLSSELLHRHPFPGPGLAIRVLGEVKAAYLEKLRLADAILIDELHQHDLYYKVSQAFAVFLPIKSVGVVGDARQYDHVIALRVVESVDFMTARFAHLPHAFLEKVANRIINEVPGISRVTYDISGKPPATIEWE